jgi:hypothetical protein
MKIIDAQTAHGHTTIIPKEQFLMLMYELAEELLFQHLNARQIKISDERYAEMQEEYIDEAEAMLIRNGILKGE